MNLVFDIETDGLNAMQNQIVGISFSTKEDTGVYIPIEFKNKLRDEKKFDNIDLLKEQMMGRRKHKTVSVYLVPWFIKQSDKKHL